MADIGGDDGWSPPREDEEEDDDDGSGRAIGNTGVSVPGDVPVVAVVVAVPVVDVVVCVAGVAVVDDGDDNDVPWGPSRPTELPLAHLPGRAWVADTADASSAIVWARLGEVAVSPDEEADDGAEDDTGVEIDVDGVWLDAGAEVRNWNVGETRAAAAADTGVIVPVKARSNAGDCEEYCDEDVVDKRAGDMDEGGTIPLDVACC